jgi:GNAT superfamily N-acetyltransferase
MQANCGACESGIRQLGRGDETDLVGLLLSLDRDSRASRFSGAVNDSYLVEHAKRALAAASFLAGAYVDGEPRGIVEVYDEDSRGVCEAAFVVNQDWRRRGIGSSLLQTAVEWSANSRHAALRMIFSRHNWPMRKLASKAGNKLDIVLDEMVVEVAFKPSRAT